MPANLEIREDGSAAAFMGRTPGWHGLGVVVEDQDLGIEEALLLARMRYEFSLTPTYTVVDGLALPLTGGKKAVLRRNIDDDTDIKAFGGALSDRYKVHTLLDMWSWIDEILGEGATVETLGNLEDGAKSFVTVRLKETALDFTDNDKVAMYLTVSTAHDGSASTVATVSPVRVVCGNTMTASLQHARKSGRKVSVRHNINLTEASEDAARTVLRIADERRAEVAEQYNTLKSISLGAFEVEALLAKLFPVPAPIMEKAYEDMTTGERRTFSLNMKARDTVEDLMQASPYRANGSDGWSLYQAAIEYADYFAPVKGKDSDARRAQRVLEGGVDKFKEKALTLITA